MSMSNTPNSEGSCDDRPTTTTETLFFYGQTMAPTWGSLPAGSGVEVGIARCGK